MSLGLSRWHAALGAAALAALLPCGALSDDVPAPSATPVPILVHDVTPLGCLLMVVPAFAPDQLIAALPSSPAPSPADPSIAAPACSQSPVSDPIEPSDLPSPYGQPDPADRLPDYFDIANRAVPDADPPVILRIELSDDAPHSQELLVGRIFTTTNVESVAVRLAGHEIGFARLGPGEFRLGYVVPDVPFFLKRSYTVSVLAATADGRTTAVDAPFSLR